MLSYIKEYYMLCLYTDADLDIFINAKWITVDQKREIIDSKVSA